MTAEGGIANEEFLRAFSETHRFSLGKPASITVTPEGDEVVFLRSGPRRFERSLYAFDPESGTERLIATSEQLLGGEEEELTAEELARRERMRSAARGIASFTLSEDGSLILVPLSGEFFVIERGTGRVREYTSDAGFAIDPRFSPDGTKVACVRGGDLYVTDLESGEETRLTRSASERITNGEAEFIAQEEMDRMRGYWWSPDSEWIAYQRTDTSALETFTIADPKNPAEPAQTWPYPRAGTANADVRLGVMSADGGRTTWVEWDRDRYPYLATVRWEEDSPLTLVVQNREQTEELILAADPESGSTTVLHTERDPAWLNLDQQMPRWLEDGRGFLWTTERNGAWQIELRRRDGTLERALIPPTPNYRGVAHVDEEDGWVYYIAGEDPIEAHIFRVPLSATEMRGELLTRLQPGLHGAKFSEDGSLMVHHFRPAHGREAWLVRRVEEARPGESVGVLRSRAEQPPMGVNAEFVAVGEEHEFRAVVIRPRDFDPGRRYPVIVHVYGGPHSQRVVRHPARYILDQWLADQGFVVVWIDGRGTPQRGRDWERIIKYDFITIPLRDQADGLAMLGERFPEMDLSRVGIFGWSFGGYFSAMAVMRRPEVFHAGVAGAPVCEWQDYDTHYTERYIGHPDEHPEAYEVSNVLTYAGDLTRPLLIVHGTADDNVYLVHSLKMSDALLRAGIGHDFLPLAGFTHRVTEPLVVRRLYERIARFLIEHVRER